MCAFCVPFGVPASFGLAKEAIGAPLVAWEPDLRVFLAGQVSACRLFQVCLGSGPGLAESSSDNLSLPLLLSAQPFLILVA